MSYASDRLREFHEVFEVDAPNRDSSQEMAIAGRARLTLHEEEHEELRKALKAIPKLRVSARPGEVRQGKLEAMAEELADEMVLLYGTAEIFGIDLDVAFRLKMDGNMAKLPACALCHGKGSNPDELLLGRSSDDCTGCGGTGKGKPIKRDRDQKILKPDGWQKPSMAEAIK